MRFNLSNKFLKHGKIQKLQWFWLARFAVCQVTFETVFIFEKLLYCQKSLQEVLLFHWFFKKLNLQNTRNFCESQNFSAKYAVLHRKLQYLKEKWCSSPKIILQNVSSQTWLQPSCDKKNHPGTQKQTFFGLAKTLRWNYPGLQNYILWKLLLSKLQNHFQAGIID